MLAVKFHRKWRTKNGTSITFETAAPVGTEEATDGNQELTSDFRLDINDNGDHEVYLIGDSNEGGFLVCEECSWMFDVDRLIEAAVVEMTKNADLDVQKEYDEWLVEYEEL